MNAVQKELSEVYNKYQDFDFMGYYSKIAETNTNNKYSKGIGFYAGLYEPSYVGEMQCGNHSIGKEIKNPEKGYDYKYYFDENGKIILSEKYLSGKLYCLNFYFYHENILDFIHYNVGEGIYSVSKSLYDEKERIIRHFQVRLFLKYDIQGNICYEEHIFKYGDNETYITLNEYFCPTEALGFVKEKVNIENMMIKENILYHLDAENNISAFYPIRFKLEDGKKVNVPLPKRVPVFKIIKENMIRILNKWKDIDFSVIWVNCESTDIEMQYQTEKEDCEAKWNIAFYEANAERIFQDMSHPQALEDLLFNNGCNVDDLINESEYFVNKMTKIIKELRKEELISDHVAVILSDLEVSEKTFEIAKKINKQDIVKGFLKCKGKSLDE